MGQLGVGVAMKLKDLRRPVPVNERIGVDFPRYFTAAMPADKTPYDEVAWELRTASIGNDKGAVIFEQRDVEVPVDWSQTATNIVVSKYFYGKIGSPERETSVRQLIGRVVDTIAELGRGAALLPDRRGCRKFPRRSGAPDADAEGVLQFAGVVQRGREGAARLRLVLRRSDQRDQEAGRRARRGRSARRASSIRWAIRWNRFSIWPRPKACCSSGARARARIFRRCAKKTDCFRAAAALPAR